MITGTGVCTENRPGIGVHHRLEQVSPIKLELVFTIRRNAGADSGDREQSVHSIMNTDSGDHEHLFAPA